MSASKREEVLSDAADTPTSVVAKCKLLSTGVDESSWDLVFMADPVRSDVHARQMIGRVSRVAANKTRGYVLIPALVGREGVTEGSTAFVNDESMGYGMFAAAFQAMCEGDPVLKRDVLFVAEERNRLGRPRDSSEYPPSIQEAFMFPPSMGIKLKNDLVRRLIRDVSKVSSWDQMCGLLLDFNYREGHCNVPALHKENGINLGGWLSRQRKLRKSGNLDLLLQGRLDEVGVVWDVFNERWEEKFTLLERFKERERHCDVPVSHVEEGVKLGIWVFAVRRKKRKGKLASESQVRLETLGISWDVLEERWEEYFALLEKFKKREGHCNVPKSHVEEGANLGNWVNRIRKKKRSGKLASDLQERLDTLGMSWDVLEERLEKNFALLEKFKELEGHCNVPDRHVEEGAKLGYWVQTMRVKKRKGELDAILQERFETLGISWEVLEERLEEKFTLLEKFREREGHCNVPYSHVEEGVNLGNWVSKMRSKKRSGKLASEWQERLGTLGISWDFFEERLEANFALLDKFKGREGHCNVPHSHKEDGMKLGVWLSGQRKRRRRGKLEKERIDRYGRVGIVWNPRARR